MPKGGKKVNEAVRFKRRTLGGGYAGECMICDRPKLGTRAVVAVFSPGEPPELSAVYCNTCVRKLAKVIEEKN